MLANENRELANRAEYQLGLASLEKASVLMSEQSSFAAAMLAARAVGFDEDPSGPVIPGTEPLLHRDTAEWRRAVDLSTRGTRLLWRTPAGVQHGGPVRCVAFSPDGKSLASASDDQTLRLWDLQAGKLLQAFDGHAGAITSVCFSPDGKMLLSDGGDSQPQCAPLGACYRRVARILRRLQRPGHSAATAPMGSGLQPAPVTAAYGCGMR